MHIERVVTVHDPDVDSLPDELRSVLTKQDVRAIRAGSDFFEKLAKEKSPKWLHRVLKECSESGYDLQFHSTNDEPYRPYFRFHWLSQPAILLPRSAPLRKDLPAFLRHIYGIIGSFRENGFEYAGGLHAGDGLLPVSETYMWVEPGGPIDPAEAVPFLESLSGSQLCYLPDGKGAWLEACKFRRVRNLETEVARYFNALLKGTRI